MAEEVKKGEDSKLKDLKAKNYLFQAIDRSILETLLTRDSTKDIWDSMKKKYEGTSKVKRAQLQEARSEFELLNMKDGDTIDDYISKHLAIVNRMKMYGEVVEQGMVVEKILRSLTLRFNYVVCSIEQSNNVTKVSIGELHRSLLVQEQRMKGQKDEEQVLKVTSAGRGGNRGRGHAGTRGGRGHGRQPWNKETVECYNCHGLGHYQSECPNLEETMNFTEYDEGEAPADG